MVNAQEYLNENYPKEERGGITRLAISKKGLEGDLDLRDFVNLTKLFAYNNELTNIDLSKNVNLIELYLDNNQLTSLDLSKNVKLTELYLSINQLTNIDLSKNKKLTIIRAY